MSDNFQVNTWTGISNFDRTNRRDVVPRVQVVKPFWNEFPDLRRRLHLAGHRRSTGAYSYYLKYRLEYRDYCSLPNLTVQTGEEIILADFVRRELNEIKVFCVRVYVVIRPSQSYLKYLRHLTCNVSPSESIHQSPVADDNR